MVPLAAAVIKKEGYALDPRGDFYTRDNVMQRLAIRDFLEGLREDGVKTRGPSVYSNRDRQNFANRLDRFLREHGGRDETCPGDAPEND